MNENAENFNLRKRDAYLTKIRILSVAVVLLSISSFRAEIDCQAGERLNQGVGLPQLVPQTGHTKAITKVAFARNDTLVVSASFDNTVKIWDVESSFELRALTGHTAPVKALAVTQDGLRVASGGNDKKVKIWDVASGRQTNEFEDQPSAIESLAFSPDGKLLAVGGTNSNIKILDSVTGKQISEQTGHIGRISVLEFSPDGTVLASGGLDNTVQLWEVSSGRKAIILDTHSSAPSALAFSRDGKFIASGSIKGAVRLSEAAGSRKNRSLNISTSQILDLHFTNDLRILSLSAKGEISEFDLDGNKRAITIAVPNTNGEISSASIGLNGNAAAIGSGDGTIKLANTSDGKVNRTLEGLVPSYFGLALSGDGKWLALGANDQTAKLFDLSAGQLSFVLPHHGTVTDLEFTTDNRFLITGSTEGKIRLWDTSTGALFRELAPHRASVTQICVSEDGKHFASADTSGLIYLWRTDTLDSPKTFAGHKREITALTFLNNGSQLASAGLQDDLRIWDVFKSSDAATPITGIGAARDIAADSSGRSFFVLTNKHIVEVDLTSRVTKRVVAFDGAANSLALKTSNDGRLLAVGKADGATRLTPVDDPTKTESRNSHFGNVHSVKFTKTGDRLFSAGDDGTVNIWQVQPYERIASITVVRNSPDWLAATPDGSLDGTPQAWKSLAWRFGNNTFEFGSVETYFNDFFSPGLVSTVLNDPNAFRNLNRTLVNADRRQPNIKISVGNDSDTESSVDIRSSDREISVSVHVTDNVSDKSDKAGTTSGAKDVRLFRNGSLVKKWAGDAFEPATGCTPVRTQPDQPRRAVCRTKVTITSGENRFSAYAFSRHNVKSKDAEAVAVGNEFLKRKGTLYVLAVGIDKYSASDRGTGQPYDLRFAVADVDRIGSEIAARQSAVQKFSRTEIIKLTNASATKANILLALTRFSTGGDASHLPEPLRSEIEKIKITGPEDAILFYFAGHGTARCVVDPARRKNCDRFYLVPYDGFPSISDGTEEYKNRLFASSISDRELETYFEPIDAANLLMVIDACNSGQVLESEEKRRGPMNSIGLAQLAYEKGMMILTASQSQQAALETNKLGHGLLTFSLLEGLSKAVSTEGRGIIDRDWFRYALTEVPNLRLESMKQRADPFLPAEKRGLQTPRVFFRRESDANPLIVSKP